MRILNSVTVPKNLKVGTLWDSLTFIVLQNIGTNEGKTCGAIQTISKVAYYQKNRVKNTKGERGILSMYLRFWTSMFLF